MNVLTADDIYTMMHEIDGNHLLDSMNELLAHNDYIELNLEYISWRQSLN